MFIAWRRRAVKGQGGGPFLVGDLEKRQKDDVPVWWGLFSCTHTGSDRVVQTPLVMESERIDGKPRQKLLHRFPSIRSCCIADERHRAVWWFDVNATITRWSTKLWESSLCRDISRDRDAIIAKLKEVVPRPSRVAAADMAELIAELEIKRERERLEARKKYWEEVIAAEKEARRQQRANRRRQRQAGAASAPKQSPLADLYAVLGLAPGATPADVKAAHRTLAKKHHPDVGGDAAYFRAIQSAYERLRGLDLGATRMRR